MIINFNKVRFKNFLSFGSRQQEIELKNGLNVVIGIDKDNDNRSNGSGKTSLLETIPFALYGQTHKNIKKEDLINWKNRKNCEVSLDFFKNESKYTVLRGIKPNILEIYKDNVLIDKPPHIREYQKILDEIIGLNFQSFISIIHSNINSSIPIAIMKKPEKRRFMEKIFKLKVYSLLNEECNKKIRSINEKNISIEKDLNFIETSIEILNKEIKTLEERKKFYNKSSIDLKKQQNNLYELTSKYKNIDEKFENINLKIADYSIKIDKIYNNLNKIQNKISLFKSKLKDINSEINKIKKKLEKNEELKLYKIKYDKIIKKYGNEDKINKIIINYNEKIDNINKNIEKLLVEKEDVQRIITTIKSKESSLNEKISNLKSHNICPLCNQKIKGEVNIVENLKNELFGIQRHIKECNEDLNKILSIKKEKDQEILNFNKKIENCQKIKDSILHIKLKISEGNFDNYNESLEKYRRKRKKYEKILEKLNYIYNKFNKKYENLNNLKENFIEDKKKIEKIIKRIDDLNKNIELIKREVEIEKRMKKDISKEIEEKKNKLKDNNNKRKDNNIKLVKNNKIFDHLKFLKDICSDEKIKQFAISSNIPYINERINHYLSEVGHNFYVILDKWLDLQIKGPGITNGSYGSLSAGEAKCIDLAMQFAFLDISRIQSDTFIDLLIEDEILDSSIDSTGLPKLIEILKYKQRSDNLKTFIISHRSEINDLDIDNTYRVIKKNGYSSVEVY